MIAFRPCVCVVCTFTGTNVFLVSSGTHQTRSGECLRMHRITKGVPTFSFFFRAGFSQKQLLLVYVGGFISSPEFPSSPGHGELQFLKVTWRSRTYLGHSDSHHGILVYNGLKFRRWPHLIVNGIAFGIWNRLPTSCFSCKDTFSQCDITSCQWCPFS